MTSFAGFWARKERNNGLGNRFGVLRGVHMPGMRHHLPELIWTSIPWLPICLVNHTLTKDMKLKRLNLEDPQVWNNWRKLYYELTHDENIQFGSDIEAKYPGQNSFNPKLIQHLEYHLTRAGKAAKVVEVGGWKGELALHCFKNHPQMVSSWHNIDMCKAAVDKTLLELKDYPFTARFPESFDWFKSPRLDDYDAFVSMHTIEHLTNEDLLWLLRWVSGADTAVEPIPLVLLEAPINQAGQTWDNFEGTHILELGWAAINSRMMQYGYRCNMLNDWAYLYDRP